MSSIAFTSTKQMFLYSLQNVWEIDVHREVTMNVLVMNFTD